MQGNEIVLDVGGATGYSAAILSGLVSTVVVLDSDQLLLDEAVKIYEELGFCNVIQHKGVMLEGCQHYGPYNAILINGALNSVPDGLIDQLNVGGRLVYVFQQDGDRLGEIRLVTKVSENNLSEVTVSTAKAPFLVDGCVEPSFVFKG